MSMRELRKNVHGKLELAWKYGTASGVYSALVWKGLQGILSKASLDGRWDKFLNKLNSKY